MDPIETFTHAGRTVSIFYDNDPVNPCKNYDQLATLACWHRRSNLGHEQIQPMSEEELRERVGEEEILAVLPLYLYQHSGMTISTTPFSCRFDSGQVGWAYVTRASAKKMGCVGDRHSYESGKSVVVGTWDEAAYKEAIEGEVATYDLYLTGECYGYQITGSDGDELDSCWGFLGDLKYVREEARSAAEHATDPATQRNADELES
jgi:hypothetical protein